VIDPEKVTEIVPEVVETDKEIIIAEVPLDNLVENINELASTIQASPDSGIFIKPAPDIDEVIQHLEESEEKILNGELPPVPQPGAITGAE